MGIILSLEPLKQEWLIDVEKKIKERIYVVTKAELFKGDGLEADTEVLICRDRDLNVGFLAKFPQLQFIFIVSAGVEKLPFSYLKERKILVANTSGVSDAAMSDYVLGGMLMYSSKFLECYQYKQENYWKPYLMSEGLRGKELLIVGAGKIGSAVAAKAKAFAMKIIGIRNQKMENQLFDVMDTLENLERYLVSADYVVCTLPLTENTYHLFDEKKFTKMKNSAVFINVSRGKLVDEQGIIKALKRGCIRGAVLDVFEEEPLNRESELWKLGNVIITPHSSGRIEEFLKHSMDVFVRNITAYRNDKDLPNHVDLEKGY